MAGALSAPPPFGSESVTGCGPRSFARSAGLFCVLPSLAPPIGAALNFLVLMKTCVPSALEIRGVATARDSAARPSLTRTTSGAVPRSSLASPRSRQRTPPVQPVTTTPPSFGERSSTGLGRRRGCERRSIDRGRRPGCARVRAAEQRWRGEPGSRTRSARRSPGSSEEPCARRAVMTSSVVSATKEVIRSRCSCPRLQSHSQRNVVFFS
jgi:hypothetical protein